MVSERELADLQERVIRLRDDRTRMLVEHQEAIAERDRRIAALEAAMNPQDIADVDAALAGKGVSRG